MANIHDSIADLVKTLSDGVKKFAYMKIVGVDTNIREKAESSILYFPVLTSTSLDPETLSMLPKILDDQYLTLTTLAMQGDDIIDLDMNQKGAKENYLKNFHTNIGKEVRNIKTESLHKSMIQPYIDNDFNKKILNDTHKYNKILNLNESKQNKKSSQDDEGEDVSITNRIIGIDRTLSAASNAYSRAKEVYKGVKSVITGKYDPEDLRNMQLNTELIKQECKKINSTTPSLVSIPVHFKSNNQIQSTKVLVGVKSVFHPVDSGEMVYYVKNSIQKNSIVFKAIQWTTGEISFFKDLLLDVEGGKERALSTRTPSRKIWEILKKTTSLNKLYELFGVKEFIPNATLVLGISEVDELKNRHNIDLLGNSTSSRKFLSKLIEIFLFINIIILDDNEEIGYFYNQATNTFNTYTYKSMKNQGTDDEFVKAMKIAFKK